jgi:hypothetical protein
VLALLEHQFEAAAIKVRRELTDEPLVVMGMEHKLQQVFLNLFLNAKDAMPKGGWLSVSTRARTAVVAEVGDTGSGIPNEYLARIYDPFFTTKSIGQGTGLGLSITYGIVREHDGSIDCDSTVGQGTRFTLSFPPARPKRRACATVIATGRAKVSNAAHWFDPGHRRRRNHAGDPRGAPHARGVPGAARLERRGGLELASRRVRRRHRRRDDAGHGRHRALEELKKTGRRPAGGDDHGVRVGGDGDLGDEARRVRLHHQAVQERRSVVVVAQRRGAAALVAENTGASAEPAGAVAALLRESSAAARG